MNQHQVEYALAVYRYKSFHAAAEALFISAPALSQQIRVLEQELGVSLFSRSNTGICPTPEGEIILQAFLTMRKCLQKALIETHTLGKHGADSLWIGLPKGKGLDAKLQDFLHDFCQDYTNLHVGFEYLESFDTDDFFSLKPLDMFVVMERWISGDKRYRYLKLHDSTLALMIGASHPYAKLAEFPFKDWNKNELPFLASREFKDFEGYCQGTKAMIGIGPEDMLLLPNLESVFANVASGKGITIFSKELGIIDHTSIKYFPLNDRNSVFVLAWRRETQNPYVNLLVDRLRASI